MDQSQSGEQLQVSSRSGTGISNNNQGNSQEAMEYQKLNLNRNSAKEVLESQFSFEIFSSGDIKQIQISVLGIEFKFLKHKAFKIVVKSPNFLDITCYRRYNEFHALHKVMKLKYQKVDLPSFPSKYTLINRTEKRKTAFHLLLNKILETAQQQDGNNQRSILQLLYVFLTKDRNNNSILSFTGKNENNVEIGQKTSFVSSVNDDADYCNSRDSDDDDQQSNQQETGQVFELIDTIQQQQQALNDENNAHYDQNIQSNEQSQQSQPILLQQSQISQKQSLQGSDSTHQSLLQSQANQQESLKTPTRSGTNKSKDSQSFLSQSSDSSTQQVLGISSSYFENKGLIHEWTDEKEFGGQLIIQTNWVIFVVHLRLVKFEGEKEKQFYARIIDNTLQLFKHIFVILSTNFPFQLINYEKENHFVRLVSLYEAKIEYHPNNSRILQIYHEYDSKKLQIYLPEHKPEPFQLSKKDIVQDINLYLRNYQEQENKQNLEDKYMPPQALQKWMALLQLASRKKQDIDLNDFVFEPIGKVYLSVSELHNFKFVQLNSLVFIRIKASPFTFQTKKTISEAPKWKQDFILNQLCSFPFRPFSNSYGLIKLEVVSVNNKGWIKEKYIEKVLATFEIQIADILSRNQDTRFAKCQKICENSEFRVKQLTKLKEQPNDEENKMKISFSLRNLSQFMSIFAESSNNIYDGVKMDEQKKSIFKYYKLNFTRYKVISGHVMLFIWSINDIFYSKYPIYSRMMMAMILTYICLANLNNFLLHLLTLILFIIITNHPSIYGRYNQIMNEFFFSQKNEDYHDPQIYSKKMNDYLKMSQCLSKIKRINNTVIVEEENPYTLSQTYQQLKKSFYLLHEWISIVVNYCEKFKNLLTWKDQNRTYQFFIFIIFLYIMFLHLPIRLLLFVGCIYNYIVGMKVFKKRYDINLKQGKNLIIYVFKKHWIEYKSWEQIENLPFPNENIKKMVVIYFITYALSFNKQIIQEGLVHFYLWITEENLKEMDTPEKLRKGIATVPKKLFLNKVEGPHQSTDIYKEFQKNSYIQLSKYLMTVKTWKNFLYNIPSDCYRILRPKSL